MCEVDQESRCLYVYDDSVRVVRLCAPKGKGKDPIEVELATSIDYGPDYQEARVIKGKARCVKFARVDKRILFFKQSWIYNTLRLWMFMYVWGTCTQSIHSVLGTLLLCAPLMALGGGYYATARRRLLLAFDLLLAFQTLMSYAYLRINN